MENATLGDARMLTTAEEAVRRIDGPQASFLYSWMLLQDRSKIRRFDCAGIKAAAEVIQPVLESEYGLSASEARKKLSELLTNSVEAEMVDRKLKGTYYRLRNDFLLKAKNVTSVKVPSDVQRDIRALFPNMYTAFIVACRAQQH